MSELTQHLQGLDLGAVVKLFQLDLTPIGVNVLYHFSPTTFEAEVVAFGGQDFSYAGVDIEGIEWNGDGTPSHPKLKLPNANKFAAALIVAHNDIIGAKITRWRTFRPFLDGEDLADPAALLSRDVFVIEQKTALNKAYAEFSLRPIYDVGRVKLPRRVCLKTICTHRYRRWDVETETFNYDLATCPYVGSSKFKADNTSTSLGSEDVCGKDLAACKLRFGETAVLPTRAFPGMSRQRV